MSINTNSSKSILNIKDENIFFEDNFLELSNICDTDP